MAYIGNTPVPQATQTRDRFVATAGQTSFATSGYDVGFLDVYLNGVKLDSTDYTATNGSDVVLGTGAASGDILEVVAFSTFEVQGDINADSVTTGVFTSNGIDDNATSTAMTLDPNGNVGIGTSTPSLWPAKLAVIGDGIVTDHDLISRVPSSLADADRGFKQITDGVGQMAIYSPNGGGMVFGVGSSYAERMRIDSAGRVTKSNQPMFEATDGSIAGNGDVYWTTIRANVGGHYNSSNGRFTAPVNGYYVFHATCGNGSTYGMDIMKNSGTYRRNEMVNPAGFRWTTVSTVMYLAAGDYVNCWIFTGSAATNQPYAGFSGYLLG